MYDRVLPWSGRPLIDGVRAQLETFAKRYIAQEHVCAPADAEFGVAASRGFTCPECGQFVEPGSQDR